MKQIQKNTPDAAESNAGDDFHILWTVRKCMELLNVDENGLNAVAIEGLPEKDTEIIDETGTGDVLLGVDLSEYFGGDSFDTATRVVVSQLKYSTRTPDKAWTAARLCTSSKGGFEGSIIHRLTTLFKVFEDHFQIDEILQKLRIKLVSNRPTSDKLSSAVAKVQKHLSAHPTTSNVSGAISTLEESEKKEIGRIAKDCDLSDVSILNFIRTLDFSDCGTNSRSDLKQDLVKAFIAMGSSEASQQYDLLHGLVWRKMMPDERGNSKITRADVLYKFGIGNIEDIFPVPANFEMLNNVVIREQLPEIIREINSDSNKIICLHAGAGMGKSTLANQIIGALPEGAISIVFDCYGGGVYDHSDDKRHLHRKALLQICNELALKMGTPLLLNREADNDRYIEEFKKRLTNAVSIVKKIDPLGYIVIVIDAADNSVVAAEKYKESSFIHGITAMTIPEGCKLLITTRTERIDRLNITVNSSIQIRPFSEFETQKYLADRYPTAEKKEVRDFREYTKGIPRVMSYALDSKGKTLSQIVEPLKPNGKSLDELFHDRISEAVKRHGNEDDIRSFLTYLTCLPSPVPIQSLIKVSGISSHVIEDITTDLWHGLVFTNDKFSLRDEDFETFLQRTYPCSQNEYFRIADAFLSSAAEDEYSSTHLGLFLSKATYYKELIRIVLERDFLSFPRDPVRNREVFFERARLAMQCPTLTNSDFLKLQFTAAEAAKTNQVLEGILLSNAELAAAYGNIQTNQRIYFQSGNPAWFGSAHYKNAAFYSRNPETHELAELHLKRARAWVNYRQSLDEEERDKFSLEAYDIANGAEAVLNVSNDIEECIGWISRWRPKSVVYDAVESLIQNLSLTQPQEKLTAWCANPHLRVDIKLLVVKHFYSNGLNSPISPNDALDAIRTIIRINDKIQPSLLEAIITSSEYLLSSGTQFHKVDTLLSTIKAHQLRHIPSFDSSYGFSESERIELDFEFRRAVLKEIYLGEKIEPQHFYPDELKVALSQDEEKINKGAKEDKSRLDHYYKHFLPCYILRAKGILGKASASALQQGLEEIAAALDKDYDFRLQREYSKPAAIRFIVSKLLDVIFHTPLPKWINELKTGFGVKEWSGVKLYFEIANKLSINKVFSTTVLQILHETDAMMQEQILAGSELIQNYAEAAKIAARISYDDGKHFFDKMVSASNEIDLEAHAQLKSVTNICGDTVFRKPKLAFDFARYIEYCNECLSGWDDFPWDEAADGILKLDRGAAFQIICQWDHRGVRKLKNHLLEVLNFNFVQGSISAKLVAGLFPLNDTYWNLQLSIAERILHNFDNAGDHQAKNQFVIDFARKIKLECNNEQTSGIPRKFWELIRNGKYLSSKFVADLADYCDRLESILPQKHVREDSLQFNTGHEKSDELLIPIVDHALGETLSSEALLSLFEQVKNLENYQFGYDGRALRLLEQRLKPDQIIKYLDIICSLGTDHINIWELDEILNRVLEEWKYSAALKSWKNDSYERVASLRFTDFVYHNFIDIERLRNFTHLFEKSTQELSTLIRRLIPEHLGILSAPVLYQLFELTTNNLELATKAEFLEWMLLRCNEKIKGNFRESVFHTQDNRLLTGLESVIGVLRYSISHPDKRIRWKSAASLRSLVNLGDTEVLSKLIEHQNTRDCNGFQNPGFPFFWMSGKLYLWIAIARICHENLERMQSLAGVCYQELSAPTIPHALILYFAKSACIKLQAQIPRVFTEQQNQFITETLTAKIEQAVKNQPKQFKKAKRSQTRFKFDSLDTLPYWYEPLARTFNVSTETVTNIADRYIAEYWGYSGTVYEIPQYKAEWELTSNRHGDEVTVENLRTYLEYHALFCSAGELLGTRSILPDEDEDGDDNWQDWLQRWITWSDNFWVSDRRDPIPIEQRSWREKSLDKDWEWSISLADFVSNIGMHDDNRPEHFIVNARTTIYYRKSYESVYIRSALVDLNISESLLRVLQTTSARRYQIPFRKEDRDFNSNADFKMIGWLDELISNRGSIDEVDELFNNIEKSRIFPDSTFVDSTRLKFDNEYRYSYNEAIPEMPVTVMESWNNEHEDRNYHSFHSRGTRLWVHKESLLSFLRHINKNLILECEISIHPESKDYHNENSYYKLIFLIQPDGNIRTLSKDYQLRQDDIGRI